MSAAGPAFVTPHALRRFRERIARLPDDQARAAILRGLRAPIAYRRGRRRDGTPVVDVAAVSAPYRFVATLVAAATPGLLPAVVTVTPATRGAGLTRKPVWERASWTRLREAP